MTSVGSSSAPRFRLDRQRYQLLDGSSPVRLEKQPMELLLLLTQRRGQLITREEIAAALWGDNVFVDIDRNINSIVRKLRKALKDDPDNPSFLETVTGKGYRFIGPLEVLPQDSSPEPVQVLEKRPGAGWIQAHRVMVIVALPVVIAATVIFALGFGFRKFTHRTPAVGSIAVLPLDNVSGDPSRGYFADGITQELTNELAEAGSLRVIAHTSVLQYKSERKPIPQIADELGVDALIEGSVLRTGDRVRVTAQLIRGSSGQAMWANSYERDIRDVLNLQRDIAREIAAQVKVQLAHGIQPGRQFIDPRAHDAYLQGLFHYDKDTEKELEDAIAHFEAALAIDPDYAAPYAGIAAAYAQLGVTYWPPPRAMPQAKSAAIKALELDPDFSAAHVALGSVHYFYDWDWAAAEREAQKAITLSPSNAYAHDLLAEDYATLGRCDESMNELKMARKLAPRSDVILGDTVLWAFMCRKYDLAVENGKQVIDFEPGNAWAGVFLGMAYAEKGQIADALTHADLAVHADPGPLIASFRANVYALAGRRREATLALQQVEKQRAEQYSCAYEVGAGYILLGEKSRGFHWLDNAYSARSECMILLKIDPRLDSVRSDPAYQTLLRRVGLADD